MGRYLQVIPEYTEVSEFWLKTVDRRFLFRESFIDLDSTPIITKFKKISGKRGNGGNAESRSRKAKRID